MRLGQFSRKFDLPLSNIVSFLSEHPDYQDSSFHPNIRLDQKTENEILSHFEIEIPTDEVEATPPIEEATASDEPSSLREAHEEHSADVPLPKESDHAMTAEEEIAALGGDLAIQETPESQEAPPMDETTDGEDLKNPEDDSPPEKKSMPSDQLLEMLESEDPVNLEEIQLIKAPKRELAGLKVLGKVEIAEPKKKNKTIESEEESKDRQRKRELSEQEKEKRRLKAKRKKEAYEAKKLRIEKEKEARRLKEIKERHYREKLEQQKAAALPKRKKKQELKQPETSRKKDKASKPTTILGRFWKWMNT